MLLMSSSGSSSVVGFIFLVALYFIPTIVATSRKVTNAGSVFVINFFLGWSIIGWIVALAMAVKTKTPQSVIVSGEARQPSCAKCRTPMIPGHPFCSKCGAPRATTT